ncbi:MAG: 3-dehydroquinate dehydratase [Polyangiaceae bacterium]|nr:3-dehydroquinate dehydratase [Polyangiaceae bacterium]
MTDRNEAHPTLRIRVLSGPNLDLLGTREPEVYGRKTLADIHLLLEKACKTRSVELECLQSNHEGDLISWVGRSGREGFHGVLLNAGGYTHTSVALLDAVRASGVPTVEVHLSNPEAREPYRRKSLVGAACVAKVTGFGASSYLLALLGLIAKLRGDSDLFDAT